MGPALLPILGVISIAGTLESASQSRSASAARGRQAEAERKISLVKQKREKRNQIRRTRQARAEIEAQGVAQGGSAGAPSTAVSGGVAGVESQLAYNLSFLDQVGALNQDAFAASKSARAFESRARTASTVATVAGKFAAFNNKKG